jgi:hypothetical protein
MLGLVSVYRSKNGPLKKTTSLHKHLRFRMFTSIDVEETFGPGETIEILRPFVPKCDLIGLNSKKWTLLMIRDCSLPKAEVTTGNEMLPVKEVIERVAKCFSAVTN